MQQGRSFLLVFQDVMFLQITHVPQKSLLENIWNSDFAFSLNMEIFHKKFYI